MTNRGTSGTQINTTAWMRRLSESFPCSYTVWKNGTQTMAECNIAGETDYTTGTDAVVIQNALDTLTHGGLAFLRYADYNIGTTTIQGKYDGIRLVGESIGLDGQTKITYSGTGSAVQFKKSDLSSLYGYEIKDVYIDAGAGAGATGLELYNSHWGNVENVYAVNGTTGIKVDGAWETQIHRCVVRTQSATNILLDGHAGAGANQITIGNCYLDGNGTLIDVQDTTSDPLGITIRDNDFGFGNNTVGIKVTYKARKMRILHNYMEEGVGATGTKHIWLAGTAGKIAESISISDNIFVTNNTAMYLDYVTGVDITNNYAYGYGTPVYVYMTANPTKVTHRKTTFSGAAFTNTTTSEMCWLGDAYTEAEITIPICNEYITVANAAYDYKYYCFRLDTSKYKRIIDAVLEATMKAGAGQTVYCKLVKSTGGWADVTGSEVTTNAGWILLVSGDFKANLTVGQDDYMIMVKTSAGTSEIQRVALRLRLG
jgi:hypothetical protein